MQVGPELHTAKNFSKLTRCFVAYKKKKVSHMLESNLYSYFIYMLWFSSLTKAM